MSVEASSVPVHVGANIEKRFRTSATTRTKEYKPHICTITKLFSLLKHFVWTQRPRGREGGSSQDGQLTAKARPHGNICAELKCLGCVDRWNKDERIRTNMQEHSNTLEDVRKWDTFAAPPTQYSPSKGQRACRKMWQLAQTRFGGHNSTMSSHHPEYGLIFQIKPKFTKLPTTPAANYRERSSERTQAQNTQWPSSSSPKHGSGRVGNGRKDGGVEMCP